MSLMDHMKDQAPKDRHWKQVESGLTSAAAAAVIFIAKSAITHAKKPKSGNFTASTPGEHKGFFNKLLEGF